MTNDEKLTAYCVKCKEKREIEEPEEVEMKGKGGVKRRAMTGKCPTCGTKMFRILGKKD
jgi:Zn finger protein HypA/HybF involved in hydrogenase expression